MTGLLDRYSRYAGREAAAATRAEREGYGGIGVTLRAQAEGALIESVDAGAPAAGAGLSTDDVIVAIDGRALTGLPLATIADRLRGPVDRMVLLTIRRMGLDSVLDVEVGRTRIVPNTVALEVNGALAVIRITGFNRLTAKRLSEALARATLIARPRLDGIVLDLRGNLGGVLDQAIEAADLLLDRGVMLETYGRHPGSRQHFEAEPGDVTGGLPIVVLIDGASASSAEILASALQDNDRAVVVGASSFGKGLVQTVIPLDNGAGAGGELVLTWAEFVAPSGYGLHLVGVLPTVCTSGAASAGAALRAALADEAVAVRRAFAVRRSADHRDIMDRRRALALCPWRPTLGGSDIDMEVAERVLQSPQSYAALRRAALPPATLAAP
jgi:carboxyl-terminal processing protease